MGFLIEKFWLPIVVATLLGILIGWATCRRTETSWSSSWLPFAIVAFVLGVFAAMQMMFMGRPGLWLESALLMFSAYMLGCCVGCALRSAMFGADSEPSRHSDLTDYTMRVAQISNLAMPMSAATVPYGSTNDTATALPRTYALRSSATDYTMIVAAVNTTAATAVALARTQSLDAAATLRHQLANKPDSYTMPVAAINTLAGRTGVAAVKRNVDAWHSDTSTPGGGAPSAGHMAPSQMVASAMAGADAAFDGKAAASSTIVPARLASTLPAVGAGIKPPLLAAPRNGRRDDLCLIWGVAEKLEERMNKMGLWHFDQIAQWTPDHVKWFEFEVEGFKGRVERDKWIEQCKKLADGWRPEGIVGERQKS